MLCMPPIFSLQRDLAGVRCPPNSRPWIYVSSGRWGAPRLRAAAPLPALLAVRVSPATSGNLQPLGSPPAARPRPNAVTLDPRLCGRDFGLPIRSPAAPAYSPRSLIAGRSSPFPLAGVRAPCGRPRPATQAKPAPRVAYYVFAGIVAPFRSPRGQNKAGSKQIWLFTSGGIFWAFFFVVYWSVSIVSTSATFPF